MALAKGWSKQSVKTNKLITFLSNWDKVDGGWYVGEE